MRELESNNFDGGTDDIDGLMDELMTLRRSSDALEEVPCF